MEKPVPPPPASCVFEKLKNGIHLPTNKNSDERNLEEKILPFHLDNLTSNMQRELRDVLKETEDSKRKGLAALRELVRKEKKLCSRDEDGFLLQYLRARKYNVTRAFKLLQNYYTLLKDYKHIYAFSKETSDTVKKVLYKNYGGFLTSRDRWGSVVLLMKVGEWDPEEETFEEMFQAISGCVAHAIEIPATQVTGFRVIMDFRNLTWKHITSLTPKRILLLIRSSQFCFPGRYRGFHLIGESKFFTTLWAASYPFLTRKLRSRIHLHGTDLAALQKYIDPSILPEEFGGLDGPFDNSSWVETINRVEPELMEMLKYGYKG